MVSPAEFRAVRVAYCLEVDQCRQTNSPYDIAFKLHFNAQALPFEPFLTLLRTEYKNRQQELATLLQQTVLTKRLQSLLFAWFFETEPEHYEPSVPDEYHYEQNCIRQALFELIHLAFADCHQRVLIQHAEHLPVTSSKLIQDINSSANAGLTIDLLLTPQDLQRWWPEDEIQRQLKHRFLVSGKAMSPDVEAHKNIHIGAEMSALTPLLEWASRLYCGGELKHLLTACSYQLDTEQKNKDQRLRQLSLAVEAATFLGHGEECSRLLSNLENTDWRDCDRHITYQMYVSRYKAYIWFHHFKDALTVANEFLQWSDATTVESYKAHAQTLQLHAQCMNGQFRHVAENQARLESQLRHLQWPSCLHFVRSSYWFDHLYTLRADANLLEHCTQALAHAEEDENLHALTRALHFKGIVHQHHGRFEQALRCLNPSIEQSYALENTRRTYYALNGKAYLLVQLTEFEKALAAVEEAFQLVVQDNNYEQICTTLCNAALTALFAEHYSSAIKAIDEVFSTMLIRGIPNTRFRSNHELRAIQSIAALFASDRQFALAIFKVSEPEPANTVEGRFMQSLMNIIEQFDDLSNEEVHEAFNIRFEQAREFRIPLLALFVLKVQHHLMREDNLRFSDLEMKSIRSNANRYAQTEKLQHCLHWFDGATQEKTALATRFNKLTATKISQREAQIDLLRIENALLNIALDMETHVSHCSGPDDLFEFCIDKLYKSISLESINIEVRKDSELTYQNSIGPKHPDRQPHQFVFYYDQREVTFTIQFDAKAEVFTDQLMNWTTRFIDQLESAVTKIVDRNKTRALVHIDHLTGLKNRAAFDDLFTNKSLTHGDFLSVAYIDLNNFKTINDQHGHLTGDAILTAFAEHLKHSVRSTDDVFRIGGDEFFIVFHQTHANDVEQTLQKKLMSFFTRPRRKEDPHSALFASLGCSIGLLEILSQTDSSLDQKTIVELSDQLMYRAKGRQGSHIEKAVIEI